MRAPMVQIEVVGGVEGNVATVGTGEEWVAFETAVDGADLLDTGDEIGDEYLAVVVNGDAAGFFEAEGGPFERAFGGEGEDGASGGATVDIDRPLIDAPGVVDGDVRVFVK